MAVSLCLLYLLANYTSDTYLQMAISCFLVPVSSACCVLARACSTSQVVAVAPPGRSWCYFPSMCLPRRDGTCTVIIDEHAGVDLQQVLSSTVRLTDGPLGAASA